jgi:hypothetical protein
MVKKNNSKKAIKHDLSKKIASETSYIDWKLPAMFVAGILVTVLYYNLPAIDFNAAATEALPTLYLLNDATCALCNDSWITQALSESFNFTLERIDSNSAQGQELISSLAITSVPAVLLSSNFVNNSAYSDFSNYLVKDDDYYILRIQGVKDLTREESSTPTVDLFVMSKCPYGIPAQANMINLKKAVPGFDLNIHYIVDVQTKAQYDAICADAQAAQYYGLSCNDTEWEQLSPGSQCELKSNNNYYCSLHGPEELNIDIVQICAMNISDNWGEFILEHIASNFNDSLAANASGIDYNELMSCANSSMGLDLLDANIAMSNELSIGTSPSYVFDNILTVSGQDPSAVLCTLHPALAGCENVDKLETAISTGSC